MNTRTRDGVVVPLLAALIALPLSLVACGGVDDDLSARARSSAISATDPDPELPSPTTGTGGYCNDAHVVYLRDASGQRHCSGVVLAADLILTAAHCAFESSGAMKDISALTVGVGGAGCKYGTTTIKSVLRHPKYGNPSTRSGVDLAVLELSSALASATPVTLASATVGGHVTVSGFGFNRRDAQRQTCTDGSVTSVLPTSEGDSEVTLDMGDEAICEGDSGGAVFEKGTSKLVGIVSGGVSGRHSVCGSTVFAGVDWAFVRAARTSMASATAINCTAGATRACRTGATCPDTNDTCRFGTSTCGSSGRWGSCTLSTIRVWNETQRSCVCANTCTGGLTQDMYSCECVDQCGDGHCSGSETVQNCAADCNRCGNGICGYYETPSSCPQDCPVPSCGDGTCNGTETSQTCAVDCGMGSSCGDGICGISETTSTCYADCGYCGDGVCSANEHGQCAVDCGTGTSVCICGIDCTSACCGDGTCDSGETSSSCSEDCGGGGGGGGSGGADGGDGTVVYPCNDWDDAFWATTFGQYAFEAYLYFCGGIDQ